MYILIKSILTIMSDHIAMCTVSDIGSCKDSLLTFYLCYQKILDPLEFPVINIITIHWIIRYGVTLHT